jgi:hypothetical protein
MGYTSKVAGQVSRVKQHKKTKLMLECKACHKRHDKILPDTKKKIEIMKEEKMVEAKGQKQRPAGQKPPAAAKQPQKEQAKEEQKK